MMYKIVTDEGVIALCDEPWYVRKKTESGAWIHCGEDEAEMLSVNGTLYSLDEVIVAPQETGTVVFEHALKINEQGVAIVGIEDSVCELDSLQEERLAMIEQAITELDAEKGGI